MEYAALHFTVLCQTVLYCCVLCTIELLFCGKKGATNELIGREHRVISQFFIFKNDECTSKCRSIYVTVCVCVCVYVCVRVCVCERETDCVCVYV